MSSWKIQPPHPPALKDFPGTQGVRSDGSSYPIQPDYTQYLSAHEAYVRHMMWLKEELHLSAVLERTVKKLSLSVADAPLTLPIRTAQKPYSNSLLPGGVSFKREVKTVVPPQQSNKPLKVARRKLRAVRLDTRVKKVEAKASLEEKLQKKSVVAVEHNTQASLETRQSRAEVRNNNSALVGRLRGAVPLQKAENAAATLVAARKKQVNKIDPALEVELPIDSHSPGLIEEGWKLVTRRKRKMFSTLVNKDQRLLRYYDTPSGTNPSPHRPSSSTNH